ncbi:MAG: hypothetical protein KC583_24810 [Myxococcales bacterium]|nr:hypothetical protein [Myxococcales bacterium]
MLRVVTTDLLLPANATDVSQAFEMGEFTRLQAQVVVKSMAGVFTGEVDGGVRVTPQGSHDLENWTDIEDYQFIVFHDAPSSSFGPNPPGYNDLGFPYIRYKFVNREASADVLLGCSVGPYKS